jgi:hypothetical protein
MKIAGFIFFLFFYLYVPEIIFLPVSIRLIIGALGLLLSHYQIHKPSRELVVLLVSTLFEQF